MEDAMTVSHKTYRRRAFSPAWVLAGLIGLVMFGNPQVVAAQTESAELCDAAQNFAAADMEVDRVATGSYEEQLAVQKAWHTALAALTEQLPAGEARSAAEALRGAKTTVSDEEWNEKQLNAYQVLSRYLAHRCKIQLAR